MENRLISHVNLFFSLRREFWLEDEGNLRRGGTREVKDGKPAHINPFFLLPPQQSLVSAVSFDLHGLWYQNLAKYKGAVVCVKKIPLNQKRPELSRNTMKEMR